MENQHLIEEGDRLRIKNRSNINIPRVLWHKIAEVVCLSRDLPLAGGGEFFLWPKHKKLKVLIYKEKFFQGKKDVLYEVTVGEYVLGEIKIFPCVYCTSAYITRIFLHEICHAWIHQYRENIQEENYICDNTKEKVEEVCDNFSNEALLSLGGFIPKNTECSDFSLSEKEALGKIEDFSLFFEKWKSNFDCIFDL